MTKVSYKTVNARDLLAMAASLRAAFQIAQLVAGLDWEAVATLTDYDALCSLLERAINPDPPATIREGNIIREGYSPELDELRVLAASASTWIRQYEASLREETGIKSLKIGYNKVFGYYIEVTRANLSLVPDYFIRKQTLVNSERFVTPQLQEWEDKILSAAERMQNLEYQLFCQVRDEVSRWIPRIQATARALAGLDCWQSLAEVAAEYRYCRPEVEESSVLAIEEGRHPVVERFGGTAFVPNDCHMDTGTRQIMIITGPNMAGKSTYMRQVALIALLAHVGSFVPARSARIGVLDGIYTRIGASDDLASGRSTFMVEMSELASILSRATPNSLILLDEIGRGTGTADGLSIARATLEYIHENPAVAAKTLFATHYHQLIALADALPRVVNCSVQVAERGGEVTFLHKIVPGGSDRSYGIHVAAGGLACAASGTGRALFAAELWGRKLPACPGPGCCGQSGAAASCFGAAFAFPEPAGFGRPFSRQAWLALERLQQLATGVVREDEN